MIPSVCPFYPGCFVWGANLNSCGIWFPKSCLFTQNVNTQIQQWLRRPSFPIMWRLKGLVGWWVVKAKDQDTGAPLTPLLPLDHLFCVISIILTHTIPLNCFLASGSEHKISKYEIEFLQPCLTTFHANSLFPISTWPKENLKVIFYIFCHLLHVWYILIDFWVISMPAYTQCILSNLVPSCSL